MSEISYPLDNLLKKGISRHWSHKHSKALKEMQTILTAELVLSFFDTKCPTEIQVDTSSHGLGACLIQNKHPFSYFSRSVIKLKRIMHKEKKL